jgi:hypothetical protein
MRWELSVLASQVIQALKQNMAVDWGGSGQAKAAFIQAKKIVEGAQFVSAIIKFIEINEITGRKMWPQLVEDVARG